MNGRRGTDKENVLRADASSYLRSGRLLRSGPPPEEEKSKYVKVTIGRRCWYCTRKVLVSASDYFRSMLSKNYREHLLGEIQIPEHETPVTETAFEKILHYLNGGELQVHDDAVDLLFACSYLQIKIDDKLFEIIGQTTKMKDLVQLYSWPELGNAKSTRETIRKFICSKFENTSAKYFRRLPLNVLKEILLYPDLTFRHYKLIDCIIMWIAFDAEQRLVFASQLMKIIYWNYREPQSFSNVVAGVVRCDDKEDYLRFVIHNVLYQRPNDVLLGASLFFTRTGDQPVQLEYSVDVRPLPREMYAIDDLEAAFLKDDIFVTIPLPMPIPANSTGATSTSVIGSTGVTNEARATLSERYSSADSGNGRMFFRYDTDTLRWQQLHPTHGYCRDLVVCNGTVYAYQEMGGCYFLAAYMPINNRWYTVPAPQCATFSAGIVANSNEIYAISANVSNPIGAKYCIQMHDPRCKQWELLHACSEVGVYTRCFAKQALLLDHYLYIFHETSFDMMEIRMRRWSEPLSVEKYPRRPRYAFSLPRLPVVVVDAEYKLNVYDVNEHTWSGPVDPFWNISGVLKPGFIPLF